MLPEPEGIGAGAHLLHRSRAIVLFPLLKPPGGPGEAGCIPGQVQDMLLQDALPPPGTEKLHAVAEGLAAGGVGSLYQLLQGLPLHQPYLPLVGDAEGRVQADFVKMVPQQEQAEAVDGGNLGIVQERGLALDVGRVRPLREPLRDARRDALPHLRRCRIGKGHHQQAVYVHGMRLIADHAHDALHQYGGLAAACRR